MRVKGPESGFCFAIPDKILDRAAAEKIRCLQAAPAESDLIYLCDSEAALNKISRWIGSGPRTTLAGDANADIMISIIERVRERVHDDRPFIVLAETKPSKRHIPVWARYSPLGRERAHS